MNVLGGCPFHGRVERDEIPTRESPPKQLGTLPCPALPSTPLPSTPSPLPAAVHLNAHRVWGWRVELNRPIVSRRQWDNGRVAPVADVISMGRCYIQHTYSIQSILFGKKYRTMEHKKRSKGSVWEFCYAEKNSGSLKKKWERTGRNGSHFAHTHAAKLVVRISKSYKLKHN